jgi:hypothetical protein
MSKSKKMVDKKPINIAVFEIESGGKKQTFTITAFLNKDDAIYDGFKAIPDSGVKDYQIKQIYSEWRPSPEAECFIKENYPKVALTYSFEEGDEEEFERTISNLKKRPWWRFWQA